jgi:hypothetical protein
MIDFQAIYNCFDVFQCIVIQEPVVASERQHICPVMVLQTVNDVRAVLSAAQTDHAVVFVLTAN